MKREKRRVFVDMDGTLAVFTPVNTLETLYEKEYFLNLEPIPNMVKAIRLLQAQVPEVEVFILTSYLSDSRYAMQEKNAWLDKHLPKLDYEHRVFCPCGTDKKEVVPEGIKPTDYLLDDYTANLTTWEPPAIGVKLLNGINHSKGTWKGSRISAENSPYLIVRKIMDVVEGNAVFDAKPKAWSQNQENRVPAYEPMD